MGEGHTGVHIHRQTEVTREPRPSSLTPPPPKQKQHLLGKYFKSKQAEPIKKLRGAGGVATSVREVGGGDERKELGEKRGGSSC